MEQLQKNYAQFNSMKNHMVLAYGIFCFSSESSLVFLSVCQIRNGSTASAPLLGQYCGNALPSPIFPRANELFLHFQSDFSAARNGFEITWTSSPQGERIMKNWLPCLIKFLMKF